MNVFVVSIPNESERVIWKFEMDFMKPFCSSSSEKMMTYFLSILGLKMSQDLENWVAHPHQKVPGIPPNPRA